jgi:hypothetical protein
MPIIDLVSIIHSAQPDIFVKGVDIIIASYVYDMRTTFDEKSDKINKYCLVYAKELERYILSTLNRKKNNVNFYRSLSPNHMTHHMFIFSLQYRLVFCDDGSFDRYEIVILKKFVNSKSSQIYSILDVSKIIYNDKSIMYAGSKLICPMCSCKLSLMHHCEDKNPNQNTMSVLDSLNTLYSFDDNMIKDINDLHIYMVKKKYSCLPTDMCLRYGSKHQIKHEYKCRISY